HERHGFSDSVYSLFDEKIQEFRHIVGDLLGRVRALRIRMCLRIRLYQGTDGVLRGDKSRDIIIDRKDINDPAFVIPDVTCTGFQDPAVIRSGKVAETVVDLSRVRPEGLQYDAGRPVAGMAVGYMAIFDI